MLAGSMLALMGVTGGVRAATPAAGARQTPGIVSTVRPPGLAGPARPGPWARRAGLAPAGALPGPRHRAGRRVSVALAAYARSRSATPQQIALVMLTRRFHWRRWQFRYLNRLWSLESGWNRYAYNPYSGAYGIPQAVPGSRMASAGPQWRSSARTQIRWGLRYIRGRYRTPFWAWEHERVYGWY